MKKKANRMLSLLLCVVITLSVMPLSAVPVFATGTSSATASTDYTQVEIPADEQYTGSGTQADPYIVYTWDAIIECYENFVFDSKAFDVCNGMVLIQLGADLVLSNPSEFVIDRRETYGVMLNLNGHKIIVNECNANQLFTVKNFCNLYICDTLNTGEIQLLDSGCNQIIYIDNGDLVIDGGIYTTTADCCVRLEDGYYCSDLVSRVKTKINGTFRAVKQPLYIGSYASYAAVEINGIFEKTGTSTDPVIYCKYDKTDASNFNKETVLKLGVFSELEIIRQDQGKLIWYENYDGNVLENDNNGLIQYYVDDTLIGDKGNLIEGTRLYTSYESLNLRYDKEHSNFEWTEPTETVSEVFKVTEYKILTDLAWDFSSQDKFSYCSPVDENMSYSIGDNNRNYFKPYYIDWKEDCRVFPKGTRFAVAPVYMKCIYKIDPVTQEKELVDIDEVHGKLQTCYSDAEFRDRYYVECSDMDYMRIKNVNGDLYLTKATSRSDTVTVSFANKKYYWNFETNSLTLTSCSGTFDVDNCVLPDFYDATLALPDDTVVEINEYEYYLGDLRSDVFDNYSPDFMKYKAIIYKNDEGRYIVAWNKNKIEDLNNPTNFYVILNNNIKLKVADYNVGQIDVTDIMAKDDAGMYFAHIQFDNADNPLGYTRIKANGRQYCKFDISEAITLNSAYFQQGSRITKLSLEGKSVPVTLDEGTGLFAMPWE